MLTEILLAVLAGLVSYSVYYIYKKQQVFVEEKVKHVKPIFFFGNSFEALFGKRTAYEIVHDVYMMFSKEDVFGFMNLWQPQYVIKNPDYIEDILIKDFTSFHDRVKADGDIISPQDANLFVLSGNKWRVVRFKFTPLFTSGKLKFMYNSVADCGRNLCEVLDKYDGKEVEMGEVMSLFAMDVIGSAVFGIDANLLNNPESEFRENGKKIFDLAFLDNIRLITLFFMPKLAKLLGIRGFMSDNVMNYFYNIIKNTLDHRAKAGFTRNDFVQMLLVLKEKGKLEMQLTDPADSYLKMDKPQENFELELTDNILVGGALSFLFAGFHATAMTLTYALFELAQCPEIVEKLRQEIKESVKGEVPTYEELKGMTYCEKVIKEAARKHPTAPVMSRVCNKEYTLPNGLTIKPGCTLAIPVQAIHLDPAFWPEPEVFNPDRFDTDPRPGTYLPFGEGPRICIAMRFAMMEMKFAIVRLIENYDFELSKKTQLPLKMKPRAFLKTPEGGITFHVKKIKV